MILKFLLLFQGLSFFPRHCNIWGLSLSELAPPSEELSVPYRPRALLSLFLWSGWKAPMSFARHIFLLRFCQEILFQRVWKSSGPNDEKLPLGLPCLPEGRFLYSAYTQLRRTFHFLSSCPLQPVSPGVSRKHLHSTLKFPLPLLLPLSLLQKQCGLPAREILLS